MNAEQKQEYTRKISKANRTGIIVITFEIALDYLKEAEGISSKEDPQGFRLALKHASKCVEQLRACLNYDYHISLLLFRLYNYSLECIRRADYTLDASALEQPEKILKKLHDSFEKVQKEDASPAMMSGVQEVYDGLTYNAKGTTNTSMFRP